MFKFIDTLRKKPEKKRETIVVMVSLSVTFVIALFWIVALVMKVRTGEISLIPPNANTDKLQKTAADVRDSWAKFIDSWDKVTSGDNSSTTPTTTTATIIDDSAAQ